MQSNSFIKRLILVWMIVYGTLQNYSQTSVFLPFIKLEPKNGLASTNVRKIVQDKFGFMWFATQDGLSRYDGRQFITYKSGGQNKNYELLNNHVADMAIAPDSIHLFAITPYGGITVINMITGLVSGNYPLNQLANGQSITINRLLFANGFLYLCTDEGFLLLYDYRNMKVIRQLKPAGSKSIYSLDNIVPFKNQIWVCLSGGVLLQYNAELTACSDKKQLQGNNDYITTDIDIYHDSLAVMATSKGFKFFNLANKKEKTAAEFLGNVSSILSLTPVAINIQDNIWWTTTSEGLYQINVEDHTVKEIYPSSTPDDKEWFQNCMEVLQTGNSVWLGSLHGVTCIPSFQNLFRTFYISYSGNRQKLDRCFALYPQNDSIVFVSASDGVYSTNINNATIERIISGDNINHISRLSNEYNIVSETNETFLLDANHKRQKIEIVYPELKVLKNDLIISTLVINDTLTMLASDNGNGIYCWNIQKKTVKILNLESKPLHLTSTVLNRLYLNKDKNKVFILCDNQLSTYDPIQNKIQDINLVDGRTGKKMNIIMDICETDSNYWLAVYGVGIVKLNTDYKIQKIYNESNGLSNLGLYKIFPVGDSVVIASSNNGLVVLQTKTTKAKMYYNEDGIHSNEFEEFSGIAFQNKIYAGGVNGFTIINPKYFTANTTPPTFYFTNIHTQLSDKKTQDTSDITLTKATIPNTWLQTNVSFTGLNYSNPNRVTYQYRIRQQDTNWIPLNTQNFVTLIGLSPGTYTLEVKAANEDGYWSLPKQLTLIFEPKWYQTLLFNAGVALAVLLLFYGFYRYRIANIKRQQQIRQSISSDLHDDIGATLNSVKLFTHLALTTPKKEEYLNQITGLLQQATAGLRDMIWVLDDARDTIQDLMNRIQQFALPVAEAAGIFITFTTEDNIKNELLTKSEKRNLFLAAKESVTNSIKYAACNRIGISVQRSGKKLALTIEDNGSGFAESGVSKGNGLFNIRLRASQIHFTAHIVSAPGAGTKVIIEKR